MLLVSFAAVPAQAQNLEAGKSPSQIFAGGCAVCHKSPRGLLKTVAPGALPAFLRQHYTTSTDMAASMAAYVVSNGAADRRPAGDNLTRQGRELTTEQKPAPADAKPGATPSPEAMPPGRRSRSQEAAKPEADVAPAQAEPGTRRGRNAKRLAHPAADNPEARPADAQSPAAAETERPAAKQKLGKKGRRHQEEPPKAEPVKDEPKVEPKTDPKPEPKAEPKAEPKVEPKPEPAKTEPAKPAEESKPEAKPEPKPE
ncbi:MAG: hypothetical protein V4477_22620, partial [Pseudomonadota bacterium]